MSTSLKAHRTHAPWDTAKAALLPCAVVFMIVGLWVTVGPLYAVIAASMPLAAIVVWHKPGVAVTLVILMTLTGGSLSAYASGGVALSYFSLAVLVPRVLTTGHAGARIVISTVPLPLLVGARMAIEGNAEDALVVVRVIATICLVAVVLQEKGTFAVYRSFAVAGAIFLVATLAFGELFEGGQRYAGISGNPNRMVLGVLILVPFTLGVIRGWPLLPRCLGMLGMVSGTTWICLVSGSSQATAGLIAFGVYGVVALLSYLPARLRPATALLITGAMLTIACLAAGQIRFSNDIRSLSGRIPLYESAIREIADAPLLGSGRIHVAAGLDEFRSAHSAVLGYTSTGGIVAGMLWLIMMGIVVAEALRLSYARDPAAIGLFALAILQFVQSVEYIVAVWSIIIFAATGLMERSGEVSREAKGCRTGVGEFLPERGRS